MFLAKKILAKKILRGSTLLLAFFCASLAGSAMAIPFTELWDATVDWRQTSDGDRLEALASISLAPAAKELDHPPHALALRVGGGPGDGFEFFLEDRPLSSHARPWWSAEPMAIVLSLPESALADGEVALRVVYRPLAGRDASRVPIDERIEIGSFRKLRALTERRSLQLLRMDVSSIFLALIFALVSAYSLRRYFKESASIKELWFASACAITALYLLLVSLEMSGSGSHAAAIRRLSDFCLHLGIAVFIQFLWPFLGRQITRSIRMYQALHLASAVFVLVVPDLLWVLRSEAFRWLLILPLLVSMAYILVKDIRHGGKTKIVAAGGFIGLLGGGIELLYQVLGLGTTFPLPAWGYLYFLMAVTLSPSGRSRANELEFEELRQQLDRMVEDRTEEISTANERLKAEIIERQLAEGAMRMLERAVEQSIDGLLVSDLNGHTQFVNESWARMHGYEVLDLLGHHLSLFHTSDQMLEEVVPMLDKVRLDGADQGEIGHRHKDGHMFPTLMSVTLLVNPEKGPEGFVVFARDVTERNKAEEDRLRLEAKVQQAQKLESLGVLAGGIAHDYNNLLTGVLGHASLALVELPEDSSAREKIEQIEQAAERAADLAGQLLAYAGKNELFARRLQLNELIGEMAPLFESAAIAKGVELKLYLREGIPTIAADPSQIRQVLVNLVANASEAIVAEQGVVTIRTSKINASRAYLEGAFLDQDLREGEYVLFGVSDNGIGMDEETRSKMFDPFFSGKRSGRGLGLAAVLGIVRGHRGTIKVYSQPGRGTTVEVLFPIMLEKARPVLEEAGLRDWRGEGTVLLVDDEPMIRGVATDVLENRGFEVLTAADGRTALELFAQKSQDIRLVLLDRTMPHTNVEEVFRQMCAIDADVRVILMSGYKEKEVMEDLGLDELAAFLQKPFRPDELLVKVREVLEDE